MREIGHSFATPATSAIIGNVAPCSPQRDCIEMLLNNIEAELADVSNRSESVTDKLAGSQPQGQPNGHVPPPAPSTVVGRLHNILDGLRGLNQELIRAHQALCG